MGRFTDFFKAGFDKQQIDALKNITAYPYITPAGDGKVFYVDPGASVTGSGKTPDSAYKTLAEGIAAAVDGRGDIILCLPGTETVTAAVTVNKGKLTIASVPHLGGMQLGAMRYKIYNSTGTAAAGTALNLTKQCQLVNIDIQSKYNTTDCKTVVIAATAKGSVIDGCTFVAQTAVHNVGISIDDATNGSNQIRNCTFSALLKGIDFTHATDSIGDSIEGNTFLSCGDGAAVTGGGVFWTNSSAYTTIRDNTFQPCTWSGYPALNFNGKQPTGGCYVTNNTFVGESVGTCCYYNSTLNTYAAWLAASVYFTGNKFNTTNTDYADGWTLSKTAIVDLSGAAANLFTVTGLVECKVFGQVTTAMAGGAGVTLTVGTAANATAFANVTDAKTGSTIGDIIAGTSATTTAAALSADSVVCAASTIIATPHADFTAGAAIFYALWRPLTPGSTVVTA